MTDQFSAVSLLLFALCGIAPAYGVAATLLLMRWLFPS